MYNNKLNIHVHFKTFVWKVVVYEEMKLIQENLKCKHHIVRVTTHTCKIIDLRNDTGLPVQGSQDGSPTSPVFRMRL